MYHLHGRILRCKISWMIRAAVIYPNLYLTILRRYATIIGSLKTLPTGACFS